MKRFVNQRTPLSGVYEIDRTTFVDERGAFSRLFCTESFQQMGISQPIVQINSSLTKKQGCVRGLHYQRPPFAEVKIVSCLQGEVFDVAVDIRKNSPTFLHWFGVTLSPENNKSLLIPEGFAHGFQALTDHVEILYFVTQPYTPDYEAGLNFADPKIAINWPLTVSESSEKDGQCPYVGNDFTGLDLIR